jgi:serine/threonine protein kinase
MEVLIEGMSALQEIHSHNLIHRDVKAANILIGANGKFKMSFFFFFHLFYFILQAISTHQKSWKKPTDRL